MALAGPGIGQETLLAWDPRWKQKEGHFGPNLGPHFEGQDAFVAVGLERVKGNLHFGDSPKGLAAWENGAPLADFGDFQGQEGGDEEGFAVAFEAAGLRSLTFGGAELKPFGLT